jgi:class 3 adenylate cyclase
MRCINLDDFSSLFSQLLLLFCSLFCRLLIYRIYTGIVAIAFIITSLCFVIYERLVTRREKLKTAALQVVASLFPSAVQDQVLKGVNDGIHGGGVIANFFPSTTVLFADIAGFTAWSSSREPEQVFQLLETVYGAMDQIALRRGVFKVETVGDCYVAVCGLPEPREDHAVAMTRFARDCQLRMSSLSQQLEVALGPDTADLSFR